MIKAFITVGGFNLLKTQQSNETSDMANGINVSGEYGKDYEYWKSPDVLELTICSDGMVLSGESIENTTIIPRDNVSKLIFDNFDQGEHVVNVDLGYRLKKEPITIVYKGNNNLFNIGDTITDVEVEVIAYDYLSELHLTSGISSDSDINIHNGIIYAGCLSAGKNLNIIGNTQIYLTPSADSPDKDDAFYEVGICAFNKLKIDLSEGGKIEINNYDDPEYNAPVYGYRDITFGDDTIVVNPENAYIALEKGEPKEEIGYVLYDASGLYPENVIIMNRK